MTPEDIEKGAIRICQALRGKYVDALGRKQDVRGDISKVKLVPKLGEAAETLLRQLDHF